MSVFQLTGSETPTRIFLWALTSMACIGIPVGAALQEVFGISIWCGVFFGFFIPVAVLTALTPAPADPKEAPE